jgi:hypothetical protein
MGVSYNFGQLIICLETWLRTHEKKFNKKNLKTKNFLAAPVEKKPTFLTISPQPKIRNLRNLACLVGNPHVHLRSKAQKII